MAYHILQAVAAPRYVFMTFLARRQLSGMPLMFTKTMLVEGGQGRGLRASSMRVTPSDLYLAGMFGNVFVSATPDYNNCGYALYEEFLFLSKVEMYVTSNARTAPPNLSG